MADISKIVLPDNSEYNLKDATSGYIKSPNIPYCTSATAAGTAAKTATLVSGTFTEADLVTGAQVAVKFTNENSVASPTLSVNGTTAKSIKRYGTTAPGTSAASSWNKGSVVIFTYDGTYWQQACYLNSTYSEISVANITNGTGSSTGTITGRRAKAAVEAFAPVTSVNGDTGAVTLTASDVGALPSTTTYVSTVNGNSGAVTVNEAMTPLIGDTDEITPAQVKTALREGRDICITGTGALSGVNLDLRFTSWNGATDTPYSGQAVDIVASQTIAYYGTEYYLFELVGTVALASWELFSTTLASGVTSADISAWNGAVTTANTALSGVNGTLIYDHTYTISNGVATFTPHVYLKGAEVTTNYAASCFVWKYKLADNVTGTPSYVNLTTNNDRTCTVTISSLGYGGYVLGEFTPPSS